MKRLIEDIKNHSAKRLEIKRNSILGTPGEINLDVYCIESGCLKVSVYDELQEQIIRFGYTGDILVALDSYLSGKPSQFHIETIRASKIIKLNKSDFEGILFKHPEGESIWKKTLEGLILQQLEREVDILTSSPAERYRRVLKRSPRLFQEVPSKYIANYLRMSPETLSRLKNLDLNQE